MHVSFLIAHYLECLHHSNFKEIEMDHVYKSQLQTYALKQNLDLPVYATEREGPPHAPRFRCKVTFCGQTFQSQEFFPTLKSAEHAAAKIALASSSSLTPEGMDAAYKNLLQEIAQKENSPLPVYATATSGPSHAPTFSSTVEIAGKVFRGEEAKTKKLAEMSAAKVAFMSIKNGNSNQTSSPSLPCERQEAANSSVKSSLQEIHSQPSKVVTADVPSKWIKVYEDELPDVHNAPASNAKEINVALPVPENPTNDGVHKSPTTHRMKMSIASSSFSSPLPQNPTNDSTLSAPATNAMEVTIAAASLPMPENPTNDGNEASSCVDVSEKKLIMGTGHLSIPSGQHVVCRPWKPKLTLPQDAEMLFRDDRFIAYRLVKP